jgi:glc operon protein GlcG
VYRSILLPSLVLAAIALAPSLGNAQDIIPYGAPISLEQARKVVAAAEAEAKKQKWPVAIAVVDASGHLVAFARMDDTQLGSIEVALQKAKTSALFRRSTKVFEDALISGGANLRVLKAPQILPIEGGLPIIVDGKVIGAVGVSGVKPNEDGQTAQAGLSGLK